MSSGRRTMKINTQERAISPDINRLQAFVGSDEGEFFRMMLNIGGSDDVDAGVPVTSAFDAPAVVSIPLSAEIINGLLVLPENASLKLRVTPGAMYVVQPDGDADASPYKFVSDPGISSFTTSGLAMTANTSGQTRYDLVECKVEDETLETDNRDIYDAGSSTFTATSVTKVTRARASIATTSIRVRAGTPGAGLPALVSGWVPLCAVQIEDGVSTNDGMVFWDVRPLISDRIFQPHALTRSRPVAWATKPIINATAYATVGGLVESHLNGRRVGGRLRQGTDLLAFTTDASTVDLTSAKNRTSGFAAAAYQILYLYICTPFSLPRWARYTNATTTQRVPRSPRGILMFTTIAPDADGKPTAVLQLPSPWPAAGQVLTSEAVCIASTFADGAGSIQNFYGDGEGIYIQAANIEDGDATNSPRILVGSTSLADASNPTCTFALVPGTHFPTNARWILFEHYAHFETDNTAGATKKFRNYVSVNNGFTIHGTHSFSEDAANAVTQSYVNYAVWLPVPTPYPLGTTATFTVVNRLKSNGCVVTAYTGSGRVVGYRL